MSDRTTFVTSSYCDDDDVVALVAALNADGWPAEVIERGSGRKIAAGCVSWDVPSLLFEDDIASALKGKLNRDIELVLFVDGGEIEKVKIKASPA